MTEIYKTIRYANAYAVLATIADEIVFKGTKKECEEYCDEINL